MRAKQRKIPALICPYSRKEKDPRYGGMRTIYRSAQNEVRYRPQPVTHFSQEQTLEYPEWTLNSGNQPLASSPVVWIALLDGEA